jgi:cyanate permease
MDWLLICLACVALLALLAWWMYRARGRDSDDQRMAARGNAEAERTKDNWFY